MHGVCGRLPAFMEAFAPSNPRSAAAAVCALASSSAALNNSESGACEGEDAALAASAAAAVRICRGGVAGSAAPLPTPVEETQQADLEQAEALEARLHDEVRRTAGCREVRMEGGVQGGAWAAGYREVHLRQTSGMCAGGQGEGRWCMEARVVE